MAPVEDPPEYSDCCGEPVKIEGDREGTSHYVCTLCGKPCDPAERI